MFLTIFFVLLGLLLAYYTVTIFIDLTKPTAEDQKDNKDEMEIDISNEVAEFQPVEISRKPKVVTIEPEEAAYQEEYTDEEYPYQEPSAPSYTEADIDYLLQTIGQIPEDILSSNETEESLQKAPAMTDGLDVETLIANIEDLAISGKSDLGDIIYECRQAA